MPVSSTVVRHIDYVIGGNDPSSNASVIEAENMWYRWKRDITLPKEKYLCRNKVHCCILVCTSFGMPVFNVIIWLGK
jgi:hypothetical protein